MAQDTENFNKELYNLLKVRGYRPAPLDSKNQRVQASQAADVIEFTFTKDGTDYGKVWVTIDDAQNVVVYYDEEQQESPSTTTPGVDYDDSWTGLLKHLKNWAQRRQLSFELANKDRLGDDMRQRDYYKTKERLGENRLFYTSKRPYSCGLSFKDLDRLSESAKNDATAFHYNIVKNLSNRKLPANFNTLELYGIYARHLIENKNTKDEDKNNITSDEKELFKDFVSKTSGAESLESAAVGDEVSILHLNTLVIPGHSIQARLQGFLSPKEIVEIKKHPSSNDDSVKQLVFSDGTQFPKSDVNDIYTLTQGWNMSKLFNNYDDAEKAYLLYALSGAPKKKGIQFIMQVDKSKPNKEKVEEGKNTGSDDKARAEIDRKTEKRTKEFDKKWGTKSPPGKMTDPPARHKKVDEGYHPMGKKASYNDAVPNVKIILQHNRALEEGEQRYRNVAKIFLENQEGERFLAPTTRPGIARVYARHIAEGGVPNDDKWNHIKSICEDYNKMAGFVRATRNGQFNESAAQLVQEGINHYNGLRETLHKLTSHRGYQNYFESWTPTLMEDELDESINELFVQEMVDPRIESAMPILSRLKKPVTEMSEVDSLAEWADSVINEKLELDEDEVNENLANWKMGIQSIPRTEPFKLKKIVVTNPNDPRSKTYTFDTEEEARRLFPDSWDRIKAGKTKLTVTGLDENFIGMSPQAVAEEEKLDEVGSIPGDFMHSMARPVRDLARKGGAKKALRRVVPGLGKREAGERAKDEQFHAALMKTSTPTYYDGEENPDHEKEVRSGKASEKAAKRYSNIAKGKKPFDENIGDTIKKGVKSLKRGMKGWEKGMHDVDTVKSATKTLSPDDKERILKSKVGKGSPAELQQKLINREKNKKTDENFIGMSPQAVAEEVDEGLDQNQDRVNTLGPTEKVKNNNIGKLIGANEAMNYADDALDEGILDTIKSRVKSFIGKPTDPAAPAAPAEPKKAPGIAAKTQNSSGLNDYIKKIAADLNAADPKTKIALVKELVGVMADRKGYPEWDNVIGSVKGILKRAGVNPNVAAAASAKLQAGQTFESAMQEAINLLLESTGLTMTILNESEDLLDIRRLAGL